MNTYCCQCGEEFNSVNPCCCDNGYDDNGGHEDGVCRKCHALEHPPYQIREGADGYEVQS